MLTKEINKRISAIIEPHTKFIIADPSEQRQIVMSILQTIAMISSYGAHIGNMILTILISCLDHELDCLEDEKAAWELSEAYLNFINTIKAAQQYLLDVAINIPDIKENLGELFNQRHDLDFKALYLFNVIAKDKNCALAISKSSLLTHFIADSKDNIINDMNAIFLVSVLIHYMLMHTDNVIQFIRYDFYNKVGIKINY